MTTRRRVRRDVADATESNRRDEKRGDRDARLEAPNQTYLPAERDFFFIGRSPDVVPRAVVAREYSYVSSFPPRDERRSRAAKEKAEREALLGPEAVAPEPMPREEEEGAAERFEMIGITCGCLDEANGFRRACRALWRRTAKRRAGALRWRRAGLWRRTYACRIRPARSRRHGVRDRRPVCQQRAALRGAAVIMTPPGRRLDAETSSSGVRRLLRYKAWHPVPRGRQ